MTEHSRTMEIPTQRPGCDLSADAAEVPFGSNEVRLSLGQWYVVALLVGVSAYAIPAVWKQVEPLDCGPDYRVPYRLSNDYWSIERWIDEAASQRSTLLIGDSVIWGHYVGKDATLSHFLNQLTGNDRFANLGVDGIHPAALVGLLDHYGRGIRNRDVVLHCNLLWMSSPRHDLQEEKEFAFNHPRLVSQFFPPIPCYRESLSGRIGNVIGREVPLLQWATHLQIAYFDNTDLADWTLEHPYDCPVTAVTPRLPSPDEPPSPEPVARPWTEQGIGKFDPAWVDLETSFQWHCFCRTIEVLQRRKNRVFVVLGPFNEHMLGDKSYRVYQARKREAEDWFRQQGIAYSISAPLPSQYYADASHPLAEGYRRLAEELLRNEQFCKFQGITGFSSQGRQLPLGSTAGSDNRRVALLGVECVVHRE
ncbi:MAG: hypothetical protein GXY83_00770 [Rhodopirellula sp.]|nr:hypothetical protein [Rhodopirellula sp.]